MENLSHTLLGLTLAKAGLERATPLATTALVVSSNLPDIDVLSGMNGADSYIEYHRGFTHSFVGLALLAAALTIALAFIDRRFRLRRDPFKRPLNPLKIFLIAYLGGLTHTLLDFTNAYGVRPLLPFDGRWFYGDLIFVVDPWMWLILGSTAAWLTLADSPRSVFSSRFFTHFKRAFWLIAATGTALAVALAMRNPPEPQIAIPFVVRLIWFAGFAIILLGVIFRWGRTGARLARYSLLALAIYYAAMFMAHRSAVERAQNGLPVEGATRVAAWPMPANPLLWQSVTTTNDSAYARYVNLAGNYPQWSKYALPDPKLINALRESVEARRFFDFARYTAATVEQREDGYTMLIRDLRFSLRLRAELDRDLTVVSADVRW
ncbi:MAG TPA: metal-dependent hydrolase [Blastocatellia bacterium]|nr:metal-dependent hydrolase [Blastocatellia bacterium]